METIGYQHSNKKNKEIIIEAIRNMSPTYKTHVKNKVYSRGHNWDSWQNDIFESNFRQLCDNGTITYIPHTPIVLNIFIAKRIKHIKCPYCSEALYDMIAGLGNKTLYKCGTCEAVFFDRWFKKHEWGKFIKDCYQITTKNLTTHISP